MVGSALTVNTADTSKVKMYTLAITANVFTYYYETFTLSVNVNNCLNTLI
jgi:hypothetical protein